MKTSITAFILLMPFIIFGQNVGINITNPTEKFHIQDDAPTKLLLRTSNGTSFFAADSPTNSGLLFRSNGQDKASIFYSPTSNSITSLIGLNGWTQFSNGDFRVKERIYSVNDLRLDATEQVTIEANGSTIVIAPDGHITIQGNQVTIAAEEDLTISAKNINISAAQNLSLQSTLESSIVAGSDLNIESGNEISALASEGLSLTSKNLNLTTSQSSSFNIGTNFALQTNNLDINSFLSSSFTTGNDLEFSTGNNMIFTAANNYALNIGNDCSFDINKDYILNAETIVSESSGSTSIVGNNLKFNNGSTGLARIGDSVIVNGKVGTITGGSSSIFGN